MGQGRMPPGHVQLLIARQGRHHCLQAGLPSARHRGQANRALTGERSSMEPNLHVLGGDDCSSASITHRAQTLAVAARVDPAELQARSDRRRLRACSQRACGSMRRSVNRPSSAAPSSNRAISSTFSAFRVRKQSIHSRQGCPEVHTLTSDVRRCTSLHGGGRRTDAEVDRSNSANASEPLQ